MLSLMKRQSFLKNCLNVLKVSTNSAQIDSNISSLESIIESEKIKAKKYLLLKDNCNLLTKLNADNVSQLLDIKVSQLLKWTFRSHNCALIQLNEEIHVSNDVHINNRIGFTSNSFPFNSRMIAINSVNNKLLKEINNNNNSNKLGDNSTDIQTYEHKKDDELKVHELKRLYATNEQLLDFLLVDKHLTELSLKLRFFIVTQLEELLCNGPFNRFLVSPFGSSLSGLGISGSDLDLVLLTKAIQRTSSRKALNYSCREILFERNEIQKSLEIFADLLHYFLPHFSNVNKILRARIPIIRCSFDLAPIDLDLSIEMSNDSSHHGLIMASYLYHCNQLNPCFRELVLILKLWAKQHGIVKPYNWTTKRIYPGFTSFQLTALAIYFLQKIEIIPPMNAFMKNSHHKKKMPNYKIDSIDLLREFFEFILNLKFNKEGFSILNARPIVKPDYSAIFMENPFETDLNMTKNINSSDFDKFLNIVKSSQNVLSQSNFSLADIFDTNVDNLTIKTKNLIRAKDLFMI